MIHSQMPAVREPYGPSRRKLPAEALLVFGLCNNQRLKVEQQEVLT